MATTVTTIYSTTGPQQIVAADGTRTSIIAENSDDNRCYVLIGDPAIVGAVSSTNYSFSLVEGAEASIDAPEVYDQMWAIWAGDGSGGLQVTVTKTDTFYAGDTSTFGDMKNRVASDLERSLTDVTWNSRTWNDEIGGAILDAIKLYRSKKWWFLQQPQTLTMTSQTSAGIEYVTEYTGLIKLDSLRITISGNKEPLEQISFQEMESRHDGTDSSGQPYEYCRHGGRIRLYPTPNQAYTLTWSGTFQDSALTSDTISNQWMTHGELLIRARAKLTLLRDYIKSYDDVPAAVLAVKEAEKALDSEHIARTATSRLRARC